MANELNGSSLAPKVSIIVPVYNVEAELRTCLTSVCFQTMDDFEVILVNDASPDNSQTIIDEFVAMFPDRVRCIIHEENQGLAMARRTGVLNARAPYVIFVDSDDLINGLLCERLLEKVTQSSADICYYSMLRLNLQDKKTEKLVPCSTNSKHKLIEKEMAAMCHAVFRKDFLLEHADIAFQPMYYEDAAAMPMLMDAAQVIDNYRKELMYFYFSGRTNSICEGLMTKKKTDDYAKADLMGWDTISPDLLKAYALRVIKRATWAVEKFPEIYDYSLKHLNEVLTYTDVHIASYPKECHSAIAAAKAVAEKDTIPKTVYANGFMRNEIKDMQAYLDQASKAYLFDPQVIVLDESNCDTALLPEWITTAEDKGLYFAIRNIREYGGIYLSPRVQMVTSFNREAYQGAFLVADLRNGILPIVFGARPEHPLMVTIVEGLNSRNWKSVCDCMALAAIGDYGFHLDGKDEKGRDDIHILHHKTTLYSHYPNKNYCFLNDCNLLTPEPDSIVLPAEVYQAFQLYVSKTLKDQANQTELQKKKVSDANAALRKLRQAPSVQKADRFNKKKAKLKKYLKKIVHHLPDPLQDAAHGCWNFLKKLRKK